MLENFFEQESMGATRRIKSDTIAVKEISDLWHETLSKGFSIVCFKENSQEIIAMNVLDVATANNKNDSPDVSKFPIYVEAKEQKYFYL